MKYALDSIIFGPCGDARFLAELAREAEQAGWDGFFIWDHVALDWPERLVDPIVTLAAIALSTERIRFGALVTALPRRRPWKFARETATLDHLSGGRLVVGVGIGITQAEFANMGEPPDFKTRAAMLDEGLDVLAGLWRGEPFSYAGEHYTVKDALFLPTPVQQPRIPVWVAGMWPNQGPLRRAARWDGVFPIAQQWDELISPDTLREIIATVRQHRQTDAPFDVVISGHTPGDDPAAAADIVAPYIEAGATWWHENLHLLRPDLAARAEASSPAEALLWRVRQGPPR